MENVVVVDPTVITVGLPSAFTAGVVVDHGSAIVPMYVPRFVTSEVCPSNAFVVATGTAAIVATSGCNIVNAIAV